MDVTLKQLAAFIAVAKTKSFAEAAEHIYLSQPAISVAIKNLEDIVGGPLFIRSTRKLTLTPEGEAFYPVAARLLSELEDAKEELHNLFALKRGKLAVAAMPSFAGHQLPSIISEYRKRFPAINITVHDVLAEKVVEMVRSGLVEVGITFDPDIASDDLLFEPLFEDQFVIALPDKHPLLEHKTLSWNQIKDQPLIALQRPSSIRELIESRLEEKGRKPIIELESHQLVTIIRMVVCGLGISIMPSLCKPQIEQLGSHWRPLKSPTISRKVGMLVRKRTPLSTAAKEMVHALKQYVH